MQPFVVPDHLLRDDYVFRVIPGGGINDKFGGGVVCHGKGYRSEFIDYETGDYSLCLLLRGNGRYVDFDGQSYPLKAGSLFQRIAGRRHSTFPGSDGQWVEVFIDFPDSLFQAFCRTGCFSPLPVVRELGLQAVLLQRFLQVRDCLKSSGVQYPQAAVLMLQLLLDVRQVELSAESPTHEAGLEQACRLLEDPDNAQLSLEEIAARVGLGYELFRKLFRVRFGEAPVEYRLRRRMEQAMLLLRDPALRIERISERLGYGSVQAFSRQFRRMFGVSPSQARP